MTSLPSFDPIWEIKYAAGHEERYPWDAVVSFVFRNYPRHKSREEIKILEVGCGTASNLWFAAREGFQVAGIEGSPSAVHTAQERFRSEGLRADLRLGDFTQLPFASAQFDLVIDRGSLVCCDVESAKKAVEEIHRVMLPGGRFFFNPYSEHHSSRSSGHTDENGLTHNITEGSMTNVGQICFYSRRQVQDVLHKFSILSLEHIERSDHLHPSRTVHAEWRAVAEKPGRIASS
jgi:ubiquinone/menaquinone biosynthesis C-methylase UbiE